DGRDPFWLQDNAEALGEHPVQVKLGWEQYNGSTTLKVQFLNPYGSTGRGVSRADNATRRNITNRLGSKLRASSGGTPSPAPKPAGRPSSPGPAPQKAAVATSPAAEPSTATMDEAWSTFCAAYEQAGPEGAPADREQQWFSAVSQLFPGKQPDELTPAQWATMRDEGPSKIIPF
ncbi:MAG TPA: hypothetical protein VFH53_02895, partial [Phycisphaerae bacterium]|nr:hypothetical protein [Phycisphaerae bacterium]